jgi:single stranded DNA-binding protein
MSFNNKVHLSGFLGQDPKEITRENSRFTVLQIATTDSYQVKNGEEIIWKQNEPVWHDVFVYSPVATKFANKLKKGNKVDISGRISYLPFKDEEGRNRKQAAIVADFIEKIDYPRQDSLSASDFDELAEKLTA